MTDALEKITEVETALNSDDDATEDEKELVRKCKTAVKARRDAKKKMKEARTQFNATAIATKFDAKPDKKAAMIRVKKYIERSNRVQEVLTKIKDIKARADADGGFNCGNAACDAAKAKIQAAKEALEDRIAAKQRLEGAKEKF